MTTNPFLLRRRTILKRAAAFSAVTSIASAWGQPGKPVPAARSIVVAQLVDFSQAQQDVSKDFLIGSRAAWQDVNSKGGVRGRSVQHLTLETDGTPASLRAALESIRENAACVVLSGTVGDQLASQALELARGGNLGMAHSAPWLQNSSAEIDDHTFPIFAARQEQIAHALKTLSVMGLQELGVVYASPALQSVYQAEMKRIADGMKLKLQAYQAGGDLRSLGQKMTPATPGVLLFVGGTPELADFMQGLEKQARQRYIVALADVNLQTMAQMGASKNMPVIATQPVPMVTSSLPVVRHYRETLARLFDEPPASLSLAGFIAARYTFEVLNDVEGPVTRQSTLAAFRRRESQDVGGFRVRFDAQRRSSHYVTQSMLGTDGRVIG
jgi:ABC-type branched-subunit amino acid transport system substrate-binding protein